MFLSLNPFNSQILIWVMASSCHWTEHVNAYSLSLFPASSPSPHTCSSPLLQVISLLHSPVALQHASMPACVTSTHHCSIIQQYHCLSSNVLRCTALPVCLQTARQRRKEGEKRKKKKTLPVFLVPPTTTILTITTALSSTWPRLPCQPLIPILSNSGSSSLLSPPTTCMRTSVAAELCSGWADSLRAVSPW